MSSAFPNWNPTFGKRLISLENAAAQADVLKPKVELEVLSVEEAMKRLRASAKAALTPDEMVIMIFK